MWRTGPSLVRRLAAGELFNLSSTGEMTQRQFFDFLAEALDLPRVERRVPFRVADTFAFLLEAAGRGTGRKQAPAITRSGISLLSCSTMLSSERVHRTWTGSLNPDRGRPDRDPQLAQTAAGLTGGAGELRGYRSRACLFSLAQRLRRRFILVGEPDLPQRALGRGMVTYSECKSTSHELVRTFSRVGCRGNLDEYQRAVFIFYPQFFSAAQPQPKSGGYKLKVID